MSILEIILLCVCVTLAVLFIVARVKWGGHLGLITKTIASFGFVSSAIIGLVISDATEIAKWSVGLIAIGLLCGMVGDIVLDLKVIYPNSDKYYLNIAETGYRKINKFYMREKYEKI